MSVLINGKPSTAMVDTGATHNVVAEKEAKKLGLKLSPSAGKIKAVNSEARDIVGVAKGVLLKVGTWAVQTNFMVSPMDDFAVVLGLDLLMGSRAVVFPQYRGVLFPEGSHPCFVRDQGVQKPRFTALLSAMQIKDGVRKGEEAFLVTIRGPTPQKKGERQGCALAHLAALSWGDDDDNNPGAATGGLPGPIRDVLQEFVGKDMKWQWTDRCQKAFEKLKSAVSSEPVLHLPKFNRPYEDGHPMAYESCKLNDAERRYSDFLAEFDFDLKYKPGRANQVADALSRKEPEVFVAALSAVQGSILNEIKLALKDDPEAVRLMKRIAGGETRRFWTEGDIPLTPPEVVKRKGNRRFPTAFRFAREYHARIEEAPEALERAAQRMKKYIDHHRRDVEFQVGDKVLLKTNAQMLKTKQAKQRHKGLVPRYDGPFEVVAKICRVAYRLNIPRRLAIHLVFHVLVLKKYVPDPEDAARNQPQRAPPNVRAHFDQEAKAVLAKRDIDWGGRHGCYHKIDYLIKWKNQPKESAIWEHDWDLWQFEDLLRAYEAEQRASTRVSTSSGGRGVLGP
ncbi:uncharacterized protein LOC144703382 [Wolffia australiana]